MQPNPHFHPITGKGWCWPTAICAIFGIDRDLVRASVARQRGHTRPHLVKRMNLVEALAALKEIAGVDLGTAQVYRRGRRQRLEDWHIRRDVEARLASGQRAIVRVPGHVLALAGDLVLDNTKDCRPHAMAVNGSRRRRVADVWWIPAKRSG